MKKQHLPAWAFDEAMRGSRWADNRRAALRAYLVDGVVGDEVIRDFQISRVQLAAAAIQVRAKVGDLLLAKAEVDQALPAGQARLEVVADVGSVRKLRAVADELLSGDVAGRVTMTVGRST